MALDQRLTIRLTVPITERIRSAAGPMIFHRWLPIGRDKGLPVNVGPYTVTLWFDVNCTTWASDLNEEDIARCPELMVHRIYADVETTALDHDLLDYMKNRDFSRVPSSEEVHLANRYEAHGRAVFDALFQALNRLMDYIRVEKGQFWLVPYERNLDVIASTATEFRAKAQIGDGEWFRWNPSQSIRLMARLGTDFQRSITPQDWDRARAYLQSDARPDLGRELLAGAELLAESGHDRAALTEAVSALEVAVFRFARSEKWPQAVRSQLLDRVAVGSLESLVSRLGLTATVGYLLPLIFSEEDLPMALLAECRKAITLRQNVIHQGQRQVDEHALQAFLKSIRSVCEILLKAGDG